MGTNYTYKPPVRNIDGISSQPKYSSKSRIRQIFGHTIRLDELSLRASESNESENTSNLSGVQYPMIKINDYIISIVEIDDFNIDCTGFIPSVTLRCTFSHQKFISKEMVKDGDIMSVAIVNKSDMLNIIRNDYIITNVISSENDTNGISSYTMSFFGQLFVPGLSSAKLNLSFEGTSLEAMQDSAKALGLGFATNEDNTDDKQVWISGRNKMYEYLDKTVKRSWKDEKSFFAMWIDIYYNLNFVNVNKQLMESEENVDLAVWLNNVDHEYTFGKEANKMAETEIAKVFSNYVNYKASSFYVTTWKPINRSSSITFDVGTKTSAQMFEHNNLLFADENAKKFWSLDMEPIYDDKKVTSHILLRGRANRDPNNTDESMQANYSFVDIYESRPWMGIQYTVSNPNDDNLKWDGNHHKNYLRAGAQNIINNKELDKLNVYVTVNGTNANVIKGDKIPLALVKTDRVENLLIDKDSKGRDVVDKFYSGWYYVKGFSINWSRHKSSSIISNFSQTFVLTRREWPTPVQVNPIKDPKTDKVNSEITPKNNL